MLNQKKVIEELNKQGVTFFTGVPDSYLNGFSDYALDYSQDRMVIAANEGNAVGIAAGHYMATHEIPLVYMQNSGLGNAMNPLVSLADKEVYAIPMLLLIGWRGQGDTEPDHPQHKRQGEITPNLLGLMNIPYSILTDSDEDFVRILDQAMRYCRETRQPYGLIVPKGIMTAPKKVGSQSASYPLSREEAIELVLDHMPKETIFAATTGRATRELFFLREKRGESKENDYLNVGSMGHTSSVALGIAMARPERPVVVLDGDAAAVMHMGAFTMVSKRNVPNMLHIVLNNGAHESVGGQPSVGQDVDFTAIAEACGHATVHEAVRSADELIRALDELKGCGKAAFIDCRIHKGLTQKLPPIVFDHRAAIDALMENLNGRD